MRLDKYLKLSGLAKRRTVAKKLCDAGRVKVADREAKAASEVCVGDTLEIRYGNRALVVEVSDVPRKPVPKGEQHKLYQLKKEVYFA